MPRGTRAGGSAQQRLALSQLIGRSIVEHAPPLQKPDHPPRRGLDYLRYVYIGQPRRRHELRRTVGCGNVNSVRPFTLRRIS